MDEQELRAALASWLRGARQDQPPDVAVIGRRLRRRRARGALACVAVLAAVAGTTAGIRLTADRSASPPAISPAVTASAPACTSLRVSWSSQGVDTMPGMVYALVFRNASGRSCVLDGWPRVTVRGSALVARLRVVDGSSSGGWGPIEATQVALRPGAAAAADVQIGYPPTALGCVAPTWSVTPPGGGRATSLHEGPVRHGPLPAGPTDVCADASIEVSPVYPGDQPRIAPYPPQAVPSPSPLYSEAAGPEPPECAGAALRARVTDRATDRQGSFVILRVSVRGGDCTLRDDGLPVIRLNEASDASQVGKAFPTPQSLAAAKSVLVSYGASGAVVPLSAQTAVTAVLLLPRGGACEPLATVTIYPGAAAVGTGLTASVGSGLAVCGLPLVLDLLPVSPAGEAANLARAALSEWAAKRS
jgi:hypothetical protein